MQDMHVGAMRERTWDPRIGIRWEIRPRTGLRAHWGDSIRPTKCMSWPSPTVSREFARAQRSEHLILGLEHRFTNGVQLRAEAFRKQQQHPRARFENLMSPIEVFAEIAPDRVRRRTRCGGDARRRIFPRARARVVARLERDFRGARAR